jgi:phosphatidylglycerophosphate synthase
MERWLVWSVSLARIVMLPWLLNAVHVGDDELAIALLTAAMLTDVLDGTLARRWCVATDAGALLDATADALVLLPTLWALADQGRALHAPLLLALACFAHFATAPRGATRYDPLGRHLGTALYVATAVLLAAGDALVTPVMSVIGVHAAAVLVRRVRNTSAVRTVRAPDVPREQRAAHNA